MQHRIQNSIQHGRLSHYQVALQEPRKQSKRTWSFSKVMKKLFSGLMQMNPVLRRQKRQQVYYHLAKPLSLV